MFLKHACALPVYKIFISDMHLVSPMSRPLISHNPCYSGIHTLHVAEAQFFWPQGTHALSTNVKPAHLLFGSKGTHTLQLEVSFGLVLRFNFCGF